MGDCVCGGSAQAECRALVPARKEYETCSSLFCPNDPSFPDFADNEPAQRFARKRRFFISVSLAMSVYYKDTLPDKANDDGKRPYRRRRRLAAGLPRRVDTCPAVLFDGPVGMVLRIPGHTDGWDFPGVGRAAMASSPKTPRSPKVERSGVVGRIDSDDLAHGVWRVVRRDSEGVAAAA